MPDISNAPIIDHSAAPASVPSCSKTTPADIAPMRKHILRTVVAFITSGSLFSGTLHAEPAAAAAPAAPAATPAAADQTTPKATLKSLAIATQTADRATLRACFHAADATEEKIADLTADVAVALTRLRDAARSRFGDAGAKEFNGNIPDAAHLERIEAAVEAIDADTATVTVKTAENRAELMHLVRIDGKWKLSVAKFVAGLKPDEVTGKLSAMRLTGRLLADLTGEVTAGKYKSAQLASEALRRKINEAFLVQVRQQKGRQASSR